jgi:auxin efflux carrier (AEC)
MNVIINAVQSVLSIVIMIGLGYYLTRIKWFDESTSKLFTRIVINISLPSMMINTLLTTFTREELAKAGMGIVIPFATMLICYIAAMATSRLINIKPERRGIFQAMYFASNTIFMGMPVNIALFGESSTPYVLFYYAANTTLFWTLGIFSISRDYSSNKGSSLGLSTLKRIFSPPLMSFIVGVILIMMKVRLPGFIMDSCKYLGNMTTPLSLMFIGITFGTLNIKAVRFDKDMAAMIFGRFIVAPLVSYGLSLIIPIPSLMTKVFIIQAAMPVITQSAIIAKAYGADYEYATVMVTVTTIISIVFIPIYMVLLNGI